MIFRKIDSKDVCYTEMQKQSIAIYKDFETFADELTYKAGRATKKSGKASSYARYLIRLALFVREEFDNTFTLQPTFDALKSIERLKEMDGFVTYNKDENHFPSATIKCFRAYVTERAMVIEDAIDNEANAAYLTAKQLPIIKEEQLIYVPTKRKEKVISKFGHTHVRSQAESFIAKQRSNYTCEMSDSHITFLTEHHQKPYVESHHLIPMAAQDYFDYTIDFAHNIVTLCPTCHRKIHYAQPEQKKEMLQFLFEKRKAHYSTYGISITEDVLFSFYKIM